MLIPAGLLLTVPVPVPASVTVSAKLELPPKLATTFVDCVIVNVQVPVPEQPSPVHPVNVDPAVGLAVNVICVPLAKLAEHVVEHMLIPAGLLLTLPLPVPAKVTVSKSLLPVLKVAVTVTSAVPMGTVQVGGFVCGLAGVQFALKPANDEPDAAVAVSITLLLSVNGARQTVGQLIPTGELVTVPAPVPFSVTVRLLLPTVFSPKTARPLAKLEGMVKNESWFPLAISNLKTFPVSRSAVQNEVPSGSRFSANSATPGGLGV